MLLNKFPQYTLITLLITRIATIWGKPSPRPAISARNIRFRNWSDVFKRLLLFTGILMAYYWKCTVNLSEQNEFRSVKYWNWSEDGWWLTVISGTVLYNCSVHSRPDLSPQDLSKPRIRPKTFYHYEWYTMFRLAGYDMKICGCLHLHLLATISL